MVFLLPVELCFTGKPFQFGLVPEEQCQVRCQNAMLYVPQNLMTKHYMYLIRIVYLRKDGNSISSCAADGTLKSITYFYCKLVYAVQVELMA